MLFRSEREVSKSLGVGRCWVVGGNFSYFPTMPMLVSGIEGDGRRGGVAEGNDSCQTGYNRVPFHLFHLSCPILPNSGE